jgi:hypothetical protein
MDRREKSTIRFVTMMCTLQWIAWEDGVRGDVRIGWDGQCRMLVAERLAQVNEKPWRVVDAQFRVCRGVACLRNRL